MAIDSSSSPPAKVVQEQLERILTSPVFSKSDRMSRFLRFIVERALAGQADDLKEYTIALEVFDKGEAFDPRIDPTVRSEARRLRSKLNEYYENAPEGDPVVIDLPKGAYAPLFRARQAPLAKAERGSPRRLALALVTLVAVIAIPVAWFTRERHAAPGPRSLAVLPFENLSSDPGNEYFSDGLTDEILNALANSQGFKVVARTSTFQFKGKHEDVRSIGKRLGVELLLEGSVRKDGDRIRITPQLVGVADGYHLWSAEYDREWKDLFAVQREIAGAIVGALGGKLGRPAPQPIDPEAYRLYLEARHHFNKWNQAGMLKSIGLFQQVVERDPKYSPAFAGLSDAYGLLTAFGSSAIPPPESRAKAKAAALKAIELDPNSAEAWASLAPKLVEEFDWASAESAFRKALELGPNSAEAHGWYAELYLTPKGRLEEALRESQQAASLDPLSPYAMVSVARRYYFLRQYDSAIAWFGKALDLEPGFQIALAPLLRAYLLKPDFAGARNFLEGQRSRLPEHLLSQLEGELDAAEGKRAEALATLAPGPEASCRAAAVHAWLDNRSEGISELDRLIDSRAGCFQWIPVDPLYFRWHSTPEFSALLKKMNLL